jgi:hypothetical protein
LAAEGGGTQASQCLAQIESETLTATQPSWHNFGKGKVKRVCIMGKTQKKRAMRRHNPVRVPDSHLQHGLAVAAASTPAGKRDAVVPVMEKVRYLLCVNGSSSLIYLLLLQMSLACEYRCAGANMGLRSGFQSHSK